MKHHYQKIKDIPRELTIEEKEKSGNFLWANFWLNLEAGKQMPHPGDELVKANLKRLIYDQGGDFDQAPSGLFTYLSSDDITKYATHLFAAIQLIGELQTIHQNSATKEYVAAFHESNFLPKAFEQANPYILRFHIFALHDRMHDLMMNKNVGNKDWQARVDSTYAQTKATLEQIEKLMSKHPGFAHFLLAYGHYTLAIGATAEHAKSYWQEAYAQFLWAQETEKKHARGSFIVNLGQGLYKDMPFDNLEPVKGEIEKILSKEEIERIRQDLVTRMKITL